MHYCHYFPQPAIPPLQYSLWSAEGAIVGMAINESYITHLFYIWLCFMENINFSVRQIPSQELVGGKKHVPESNSWATKLATHILTDFAQT